MLEKYGDVESIYKRLEEISSAQKELSEEKNQLMTEFFEKYSDYEFPVQVEDKEKFFRVYEVEGRFVYNTKLDVGLRVKPVKIYQKEGE